MDVRISNTGDRLHLLEELLRKLIVVLAATADLKIDRCRQAEVQNLIRDVSRCEEEGAIREFSVKVGPSAGAYKARYAACRVRAR